MSKISFIQSAPAEFRPARTSGGVFWPLMLLFLLLIGLLALLLRAVGSAVGGKADAGSPGGGKAAPNGTPVNSSRPFPLLPNE